MLISHCYFNAFGPPRGLSVEDSEVDSGLNSGIGLKILIFDTFLIGFSTSLGHRIHPRGF